MACPPDGESTPETGHSKRNLAAKRYSSFPPASAEAGQKSEAQAAVEKAIQLQPALSIDFCRSQFFGMHETALKSLLDSLRKAGLPE